MTKGRKTDWRERIDIVLDCLAKGKNYEEIANLHQVSYQQAYQSVQKYESMGVGGLKDGRGRSNTEEEVTPEETTKCEIKRIEKEDERRRAESACLKQMK